MTELELIQPTQLYNTLNQFLNNAFVSNPHYLVLFDARNREYYDEAHIVMARRLKKLGDAVKAGKFLFSNGTRNVVKVLKGGYESFSRMYPFLRSQKKLYLPQELESYATYPLEVIPDFLYITTRSKAGSKKMHREMNITAHVNCDLNMDPIYESCPEAENLILSIDGTVQDLLPFMREACEFLQKRRFEGRRVLIISTYCISRNITIAIAYLIKYCGMNLQDAWRHLKDVCLPMQPTWNYMQQLAQFEAECRDKSAINPLTEEQFYGKRMRAFCVQSQVKSALPTKEAV
ncbi:hypothetical protein EG68_03293 [Paragonimus skrjabini miyazakii]|uniref:Tyrosine-protein phosphatase domain-containing protein n=1 Tax=Paragonimus skrjabini miyazakii TaxID=59628 RepID=A0A8S9YZW5_9TREM|nr:hypothetical protein EG68_03293 [Paragonimus skrjabini miyazakii]